ncbi:MAG: class II fructose-bisphosphate aldolase [Candidatus Daviesbacteria bacterium]
MTLKEWLQKAKSEKFAIGAFNVGNLETFKAIALAAQNKKSPVIIESSPGETSFLGAENIVDLAKNYEQEYGIPIFINLDHAQDLDQCLKGIEAGYNLIHFDGSNLPLKENLEIAKKVVEAAHKNGILVEGEIDHIEGSSEVHQGSAAQDLNKVSMTDPSQAAKFVEESGIDILAAFFGNLHGIYSAGDEHLDLEKLQQIAQVVNCYLSLHGGSGIADEEVKEAIKYGVVKININTELRQTFRENLEKALEENPNEVAMYKLESPVVEDIRKVVEQKIEIFGSGGKING